MRRPHFLVHRIRRKKLAYRTREIIDESKQIVERERKREREKEKERKREREKEKGERQRQNEKLLVPEQSVEVSIIRKGAGTDISWN